MNDKDFLEDLWDYIVKVYKYIETIFCKLINVLSFVLSYILGGIFLLILLVVPLVCLVYLIYTGLAGLSYDALIVLCIILAISKNYNN